MVQMVEGVHRTREIIAQKSWDELRGEEVSPGLTGDDEPELRRWITANAGTGYHGVSTCRMGTDEMSVTDAAGLVRGVEGLRIIDASIMPRLITGNTNATTIMIAEKLSDQVLGKSLPPIAVGAPG
jgi:choline dehydrogenase